jgi:hypothetical protein
MIVSLKLIIRLQMESSQVLNKIKLRLWINNMGRPFSLIPMITSQMVNTMGGIFQVGFIISQESQRHPVGFLALLLTISDIIISILVVIQKRNTRAPNSTYPSLFKKAQFQKLMINYFLKYPITRIFRNSNSQKR